MITFNKFKNLYQNINNLPWSQKLGQRLCDCLDLISDYLQQIINAVNDQQTQYSYYGTSDQMSRLDANSIPDGSLYWQTDTLHLFQAQRQTTSNMKWIQII